MPQIRFILFQMQLANQIISHVFLSKITHSHSPSVHCVLPIHEGLVRGGNLDTEHAKVTVNVRSLAPWFGHAPSSCVNNRTSTAVTVAARPITVTRTNITDVWALEGN